MEPVAEQPAPPAKTRPSEVSALPLLRKRRAPTAESDRRSSAFIGGSDVSSPTADPAPEPKPVADAATSPTAESDRRSSAFIGGSNDLPQTAESPADPGPIAKPIAKRKSKPAAEPEPKATPVPEAASSPAAETQTSPAESPAEPEPKPSSKRKSAPAPEASEPDPNALPEVRVNHKAADRVAAGHPWIFTSDIADRGTAQPGQPVRVLDPRGRALGTAHYSGSSQITLRLLTRQNEDINREFFLRRLQASEAHRRAVVHDTDSYRVVHGEADLLPALVVDRYGDYLVMQTLDQGMDAAKNEIASCLEEIFHPKGIVARNDVAVRTKEELPLETTILSGEIPATVAVRMNGLTLNADLLHGQKTGIFLDQRENYLAAAKYAKGGRALDCFTSTGGFALHLAPKVESVEAVDSSGPALETARANAAANGISNVEWKEGDVFDLLTAYAGGHRQFSTVVLDPPAFAKNRQSLDPAVRAYKEINLRALKLLQPGGILVTCSCSHHLSEADLLGVVAAAALDTNRTLRVLERRSQSQDHPVLLTVPETLYLKCLILEVV